MSRKIKSRLDNGDVALLDEYHDKSRARIDVEIRDIERLIRAGKNHEAKNKCNSFWLCQDGENPVGMCSLRKSIIQELSDSIIDSRRFSDPKEGAE